MESIYKHDVELPLLEQKKKKLEEIRQFFKQPLDKNEINQHMRKYESEAEVKQRERDKRKKQLLKQLNEREQDIHYSKVVALEQQLKEEDEEKMRERKQIKERMNEYFESIKGTVILKDDSLTRTKKKELASTSSVKNLHHNNNTKSLPQLRGNLTSRNSLEIQDPIKSRNSNRQNKEIVWKSQFTERLEEQRKKQALREKARQEVFQKDYLKSILQKNEGKKKIDETDITQYLQDQNITDRERYDLVLLRANQFEEKAKLDEQLLVLDENDPASVQKAIEVNDLYIKSIQAKLKMLNAD